MFLKKITPLFLIFSLRLAQIAVAHNTAPTELKDAGSLLTL